MPINARMCMSRHRRLTRSSLIGAESGFTIIEVMIAMLVLLTGVLGTLALVNGANRATVGNKEREAATNLAREVVEKARSAPYNSLSGQSSTQAALQAQPGLADETAGDAEWRISRRPYQDLAPFVYTVSAQSCAVDDPLDNIGSHAVGGFCSNPTPSSSPDRSPDDYRRVMVTVRVPSSGAEVVQTAFVSHPGAAAGPRITSLTTSTSTPIGSGVTTVPFVATSSPAAARVEWSVNGAVKGTATSTNGTAWSFSWPLAGVPDGAYFVAATGYDANNVSSGSRSMIVVVKRGAAPPATPFTMTATAASNRKSANLSWQGAPGTNVVIHRDTGNGFAVIATVPSGTAGSGTYEDQFGDQVRDRTYVYKVCDSGNGTCSNEASVTFR